MTKKINANKRFTTGLLQGKRILSVLLIMCTLTGIFLIAPTATVAEAYNSHYNCPSGRFWDMPDVNHWAHAPIDWAVENGIASGTSTYTFSPNSNCTRAQIVTFLWRFFGSPEPHSYYNPFYDVSSYSYYYKAVLWAVQNGITGGTSATTFSPNSNCTRGQIVTFLWRAARCPSPDSYYNPFYDVSSGSYYYNAVLWAVQNGITSGTSTNYFSPNNNCTRAQVVTFLYRYSESRVRSFVNVAKNEVGVYGRPNKYTNWYGWSDAWCAMFVSWCANQSGFLGRGLMPKFASCTVGMNWFKNRGQWKNGGTTPNAGMVIFIDWQCNNDVDHVGIVEYVSNGRVYTIEGNSSNAVRRQWYYITDRRITGYGYIKTPNIYGKQNVSYPTSISLSQKSMSLNIGEKSKLSANVVLPDVSDKSVTWYSSNPNVVTVDENGNLKAIKEGTVTIVAYANAKSSAVAYCNITVGKGKAKSNNESMSTPAIEENIKVSESEKSETTEETINTKQVIEEKVSEQIANPKCDTKGSSGRGGIPVGPPRYLRVTQIIAATKQAK